MPYIRTNWMNYSPPAINAVNLNKIEAGILAATRRVDDETITGQWAFDDYLTMKMGPLFDVKAWGAVGDNATNDYPAIQGAINAAYNNGGGIVYLPPLGSGANNRYRIDETLYLRNGVSLLGAHAAYSRISAHDAFQVLDYFGTAPPPVEASGFFIKNLTLSFEDFYDDPAARCLDFNAPSPSQYIVENVWFRKGYYGYYDTGGGFENVFLRVYAYECKNGFLKTGGGTGTQFYNCYVQGRHDPSWDSRAWDIQDGVGYVLNACAVDSYHSNIDSLAYFHNNRGLTINGFVMEACEAETNGFPIIQFDTNYTVHVSGMFETDCVINAAAASNTRLMKIVNDRVHFSGCEIGGGTTCDAAGGGATGYAIDIYGAGGNLSRVTLTAGVIIDPISGVNVPTVDAIRLATAVNTVQLTIDNIVEGTVVNPNANSIFRHH